MCDGSTIRHDDTLFNFWVWMPDGSWEVWRYRRVLMNRDTLLCVESKSGVLRFVHTEEQRKDVETYFEEDYEWRLYGREQ